MNTREYDEMLARRKSFLETMECHFPSPIRIPIPQRITTADWFKDAGLNEKNFMPYALPCFQFPGFSGKVVAAFKILLEEEAAGNLKDKPVLVAATSGNFGYAMAMLTVSPTRRLFDIPQFIAVIDQNTSKGKVAHLRRSGATIVFAPERVRPTDHADELGKKPGHHAINQYIHSGNVHGQEWPAKAIYGSMGSKVSVFVAAVGSTASIVGAHRYLRPLVGPHLKIVGVGSMSDWEKVPGSRTKAGLAITGFDYQSALDYPLATNVSMYEACDESDGYIKSWISVGPTGGLASAGYYKLLEQEARAGRLHAMRNIDGNIVPIFLFMDMYLPYLIPEYDEVLGSQ